MPHRKHRAGAAMQAFGDSCELLDKLVALASAPGGGGDVDQGDGNEDLLSRWDKTVAEGVRPMSP